MFIQVVELDKSPNGYKESLKPFNVDLVCGVWFGQHN